MIPIFLTRRRREDNRTEEEDGEEDEDKDEDEKVKMSSSFLLRHKSIGKRGKEKRKEERRRQGREWRTKRNQKVGNSRKKKNLIHSRQSMAF